ncbi:MAG: pseudouridine synthase [Patescibacteria group bacterium]
MENKERINKVLSQRGVCSRREADRLIEDGRIVINDHRAQMGEKVGPDDDILVDGQPIDRPSKKIYIMLNKPIGVITTSDRDKPNNVIDFLGLHDRVFPVGRLDVESSGLLLLTNDGDLTARLTHPRFGHEKEYDVTVSQPISGDQLEALRHGVRLADGQTMPAKVKRVTNERFLIVLLQGKNRQIRRMCEALGLQVTKLRRVRVHTQKLGRLLPGQWRELTKKEIVELKKDVSEIDET